jgi:hypothetical protein
MSGTSEHKGTAGGGKESEPARLLQEMRALRDRTGVAARGYWLPLLLFGVLICGSLPFYERLKQAQPGLARQPAPNPCSTIAPNTPCHVSAGYATAGAGHLTAVTALGYYWQIAIPVGVVLTVLWYRWRGNRVGLRTPARGFLITGLILGELVLLVPLLVGQSSSLGLQRLIHDTHHAGPLVIIAALLWVLAWAERSPALALVVGFYLVAALVISNYNDSGLAGGSTGAADLSLGALRLLGLLPALILLTAGSATWLAQRLHHRPHGALPAAT